MSAGIFAPGVAVQPYELADVNLAHADMEHNRAFGKQVLVT